MLAACRIESRPTRRTPRLALPILPNRHLHPASPAQSRPRIPLPPRPNRNRMPRQLLMTILASPVHPATSHPDRHNIQLGAPVRTPRLRVHLHSAYLRPQSASLANLRRVTQPSHPVAQVRRLDLRPFSSPFAFRSGGLQPGARANASAWSSAVIPRLPAAGARSRGTCFFPRCHPERAAFWRWEGLLLGGRSSLASLLRRRGLQPPRNAHLQTGFSR